MYMNYEKNAMIFIIVITIDTMVKKAPSLGI